MQSKKVIECYNLTAEAYAAHLFDELASKPLDRLLLRQFAAENSAKGPMLDLGCGPGQTTRFLAENGVTDILGTDISTGMISKARELNPGLQFQAADMLKLDFADGSFASAVAFYAIVHFTPAQLQTAFAQINRVLAPKGQLLLSFHIGDETIHRTELFGSPVDIDFYFFRTEKIIELLQQANFSVMDAIERYPYPNVEPLTHNQSEPGRPIYCPAFAPSGPRFSNIWNALPAHNPASFCLILSEAVLLTGNTKNPLTL